jgi:Protein of unknown function (DUF1592)/Protein of unknown function (DUF1588)/Protein of unknown function (DUF1585)/Protein of unknown function (DUF1595)
MASLLVAACSDDGETIGMGTDPTLAMTGDPSATTMATDTSGVAGTGTGGPSTLPPGSGTGAAPAVPGTIPGATAAPGVTGPNMPPNALPSTDPGTTEPAPAKECAPGLTPTSQIPRLTNAQYNRTIYDLLGLSAPGLATEQAGDITKSIWDSYQLAADTVAAQVMGDPMLKANFMKCTPSGDGAECLKSTIQEFGRRAYRRELTATEITEFEDLVTRGAELTATGSADEVGQLILATFLKMPSFLQKAEVSATTAEATGAFKLSSHEVAARLSYMLWGTIPDAALDTAADNDELLTKEQVLAQAKRMVADDKARDIAAEFHRSYLKLSAGSRWDAARKNQEQYPLFSDAVVPDMIAETEMLFDNVFKSGGSFQDLLTTNTAYVTKNTAPLYGLNAADFTDVPEPTELTGRPGFLTRVGFLAAYSAQTRTSPILRGAFVTKFVLGVDPGSPDPKAAETELPMDPAYDTNRKRVEAQTGMGNCAGCHSAYINPPGFVLEAYDSSGLPQTVEAETSVALDTTANISFSFGGTPVAVTGPADMMAKIAASPEALRFYASRWVSYAFERQLTGPDQCTIDAIAANGAATGYSIQSLLTDLTQSENFMVRALDEVSQ